MNPLPQPPRWAEAFLDFYCAPYYREEIKGDLYELFEERCETQSVRLARVRFVWEVLRFFRWRYLRKSASVHVLTQHMMVKNYLKISLRTLRKQRLHSFINIGSLAIGLTACILILLYVQYERSFDSFHEKSDRLYSVVHMGYNGPDWAMDSTWWSEKPDDVSVGTILPLPMGAALAQEVPGITNYSTYNEYRGIFQVGDKSTNEEFLFVDSAFLDMFSFPILRGNVAVLNQPKNIALTRSKAMQWFGTLDCLGEEVTVSYWGKDYTWEVAAVLEDVPTNSTLEFEVLANILNRTNYQQDIVDWDFWQVHFFVELEEGVSVESTSDGIKALIDNHFASDAEWHREQAGFTEGEEAFFIKLLPLTDLHVNTLKPRGDTTHPRYLVFLSIIALAILLIASINYISLSLARSAGRNLEVGIRKSMGATARSIIGQFYVETGLISTLSLVIGLALSITLLPSFSELFNIKLSKQDLWKPSMWGPILLLFGTTTLVAGSYPAGYFARFRTAMVLKGRSIYNVRSGFLRGLVTVQIALSSALLVGAIGIYQQMDFILTKDLGYDTDQVIRVRNYRVRGQKNSDQRLERLRNELTRNPAIQDVTGLSISFGLGYSATSFRMGETDEYTQVYTYRADVHVNNTLGIKLQEGNTLEGVSNPENKWIVNQAFVEAMKLENPVGTQLHWGNHPNNPTYEIVGVMEDFNFRSLEHEIQPALMHFDPEKGGLYNILIRADGQQIGEAIAALEEAWDAVEPDLPLEYSFLNEDLQSQYEESIRMKKIISYATGLAMLVAILGLFGLSGVQALNRTKEIGIRKTLGAGILHVFVLLNKQTLLLSFVALFISVPLAAYLVSEWLTNFEYRITLGVEFYSILVLSLLTIVLLTVSFYGIKAANTNPIEALRDE